jgi:hypothetical protein
MDSEKCINDAIVEYRFGRTLRAHPKSKSELFNLASGAHFLVLGDLALFPCATVGEVTVVR